MATHKPLGVAASQMLTLEPRILLDAAAIATGAEIVVDTSPTISDSSGLQLPDNMDTKPDARDAVKDGTQVSDQDNPENSHNQYEPAAIQGDDKKGIELVIVDKTIANYETLIAGLTHDSDASGVDELAPSTDRLIEVIELDPNQDGLLQITNALSQYDTISAVHILSHADAGQLYLGNSVINQDSLADQASLFSSWQTYLSDGADILLYGCDVAGTQTGIDFVSTLSDLTGADIAASIDTTGHAQLGGDWDLEFQLGTVEVTNPLAVSILDSWEGTLDANLVVSKDSDLEQAEPGDVVNYVITIVNTGDADATNIVVSDVIGGEGVYNNDVAVFLGFGDAYSTIGNTSLEVSSSATLSGPSYYVDGSVLDNDLVAFPSATVTHLNGSALSGGSLSGSSTAGGSVTINSDGTFVYTPYAGMNGTDTFTYSTQYLTDVQVTVTVSDMVWYVDPINGNAAGSGTSADPFLYFNYLSGPSDVDSPGDTIFLYTSDNSTGTVFATVTLEDNQSLIGEGEDLIIGGKTLYSSDSNFHSIKAGNTNYAAIYVANGNIIKGLNIDMNGPIGIQGSNIEDPDGNLDSGRDTLLIENVGFSNIGLLPAPVDAIVLTDVDGDIIINDSTFSGSIYDTGDLDTAIRVYNSAPFDVSDVSGPSARLTITNNSFLATQGNGIVLIAGGLDSSDGAPGEIQFYIADNTMVGAGTSESAISLSSGNGGLFEGVIENNDITNFSTGVKTVSYAISVGGIDDRAMQSTLAFYSNNILNANTAYDVNFTDVSSSAVGTNSLDLTIQNHADFQLSGNGTAFNLLVDQSVDYGEARVLFDNNVINESNADGVHLDLSGDTHVTVTNNTLTASSVGIYTKGGDSASDVVVQIGSGIYNDYTSANTFNTILTATPVEFLFTEESSYLNDGATLLKGLSTLVSPTDRNFIAPNDTTFSSSTVSSLILYSNTGLFPGSVSTTFNGVVTPSVTDDYTLAIELPLLPTYPSPVQAASQGGGSEVSSIAQADIDQLYQAALQYWLEAGYAVSENVDFQVADLSSTTLAYSLNNTILLDQDAAGYGWYIDATPLDHNEFSVQNSTVSWQAEEGDSPSGKMDLLTVMMHEIGHVLGYGDGPASDGLMSSILQSGSRYLPDSAADYALSDGQVIQYNGVGPGANIPLLAAGETAIITYSVTLDPSLLIAPSIPIPLSNTVTVTADSGISETASHSVDIIYPFTLTNSADVMSAQPGDVVTYTINLTNNSSDTVTGIQFSDTLFPSGVLTYLDPAVFDIVYSLGSGESVAVTYQAEVNDLPAYVESVDSVVTFSSDQYASYSLNPITLNVMNEPLLFKAVQTVVAGQVTPGGEEGTNQVVYQVLYQNEGTTTITNLVIEDLLHPDLVLDNTEVTIIETKDSFETVGNTLLQVTPNSGDFQDVPSVKVIGSVLSNDEAGFGGPVTITSFDAVSTNGGTVFVAADGSLSYLPAVGFTGVDRFTYSAVDSSSNFAYVGLVEVTVNDMVWYVDDDGSATGDGRSTNPFNSFASINAPTGVGDLDGPGDVIYVHEGTYDATVYLEASQSFIGEGSDLVVNGYLINDADATPLLTSSTGHAVVTSTNNNISGFVIGNTTGYGILADSSGVLTIDNVSIIDNGGILYVNNTELQANFDVLASNSVPTGTAIHLTSLADGSTLTVGNVEIHDNTGGVEGIYLEGNSYNTLLDFGETNMTGDLSAGLYMSNNANPLYVSFDSLDVTISGAGYAIYAEGTDPLGGGVINFEQGARTTNGGVYLDNIRGTYQGALNQFVFESISLQDGSDQALFKNLMDGVYITGTGTTGSGGVISEADSSGAIVAEAIPLLSVQYLDVDGPNVQLGIITTDTPVVKIENSTFTGVSTPIKISGDISNSASNGIEILNNQITGLSILSNDQYAIQISQNADADSYVTIQGNTIDEVYGGFGYTYGVLYEFDLAGSTASVNDATLYFDIDGNSISNVDYRAIIIVDRDGGARLEGVIHDNPLLYGNLASAIQIGTDHASSSETDVRVTIQDNPDIRTNLNEYGLIISDFDSNIYGYINLHLMGASNGGDVDVRIVGNTLNSVGGNAADGILVRFNPVSVGTIDQLYLVQNNTFNNGTASDYIMYFRPTGVLGQKVDLNFSGNTGSQSIDGYPFTTSGGDNYSYTSALPATPSFPTGYTFVPMLALQGEKIGGVAESIDASDANSLLEAATTYWNTSSVSAETLSALADIDLQVVDLPDGVLAAHDGSTIYVDHNAANYGWFVDSTPADAVEFSDPIAQMDLLTVIMHEMGHVMGFDDIAYSPETINIMSDSLDVGVRYLPAQQTVVAALNETQVDAILNAAIQRWVDAGISAEQVALLNDVTYELADLNATNLAAISGLHITIDVDAAGKGWFVDATPMDDIEFADAQSLYHLKADAGSEADGQYDLLTVMMHELGHMLSLNDSLNHDITHGNLSVGERYLPSDTSVSVSGTEMVSGHVQTSISVPELGEGEIVRVTYTTHIIDVVDAGINNNGINHEFITNQAFLDADQFVSPLASNSVVTKIDAMPEFTFIKDDVNSATRVGDTTYYFFTVENLGNQHAEVVTINDALPEGTTFNSELSSPGWSLDGNNLSFILPEVNVGDPAILVTLALDVNSVPIDQGTIDNYAALNADQDLNYDASAIDRTAAEFTRVIHGSGYLWMRDVDSYFALGRDISDPDFDYDNHGRLISLDTQDELDNLLGGRNMGRYDPVFGLHDFTQERIETVKYATMPAMQDLLLSDIAKTFPGISPFAEAIPDAQVLVNQVDDLNDQLAEETQPVADSVSESGDNPVSSDHSDAAQTSYQSFSRQMREASNDFSARQDAFAKAVSNLK